MRRSLVILFTIISTSLLATAQDERLNSLNFDEEPLPEETAPYSAIGIGPVFSLFSPDVTDVNAMAASLGLPNMNSPLLMFGAEFYAAVGFVPNMRIGFSWLSGSTGTAGDFTDTIRKSVDYSVSTKTLHLDYALTASSAFTVLPGVGISWGNLDLDVRRNGPVVDWNSVNGNSQSTENTRFSQSSISLIPRLSLEYVLTPFLAIRAQGAYTMQLSTSDWQANSHATVVNMPSSVSMNGFSAQVGVFLGLFN